MLHGRATLARGVQAMFLSFDPPAPTSSDAGGLQWEMQKLASWLKPEEALDGGAKGLHAVSEAGVRCSTGTGRRPELDLHVGSTDAGLLRWGEPTPFPNPCLGPVNTTGGASYVLFNNMYVLCRCAISMNAPGWEPDLIISEAVPAPVADRAPAGCAHAGRLASKSYSHARKCRQSGSSC